MTFVTHIGNGAVRRDISHADALLQNDTWGVLESNFSSVGMRRPDSFQNDSHDSTDYPNSV